MYYFLFLLKDLSEFCGPSLIQGFIWEESEFF